MSATRDHLAVPLHGRIVEVPRAALTAELARTGPVGSLALVEAIVREAPRADAVRRLCAALVDAEASTLTLTALLALVRLDAAEAAPQLGALTLPSPLAESARAASLLLARSFATLAAAITSDDLLAQRAPLVLAMAPRLPIGAAPVVAALLAALARLQPTLGISAYRAFLGAVAELLFRALQRGANLDGLIGADREALCDRLTAELPGTPDLVAARGMAWLLGALAPGDDAARSALERARERFRDPAFQRDCDAMLAEDSARAWPPSV